MRAAALPAADDVVALCDQVRRAPEVEVRKRLAECTQVARSHRVVAHRDDPGVGLRQRRKLLGECLPAVESGAAVFLAHSANSFIAASTCAALGTLWCHSTPFSMNEMPLPFTVLAITALGRSLGARSRTFNNCSYE